MLVTDRATANPAYFVGHWVEVYDSATGALKGSARLLSLAGDKVTATLDSDLAVAPGDSWRGVYRFDDLKVTAGVSLVSDDQKER